MDQHRVALPGGVLDQDGYARDESAGKDVLLDEVDAMQGLSIALVAYRDGLQRHQAIRLQKPCTGTEVVGQESMSDGFDHLHGDELVELPDEIAVVAELDLDAVLESVLPDQGHRVGVLRGRQGRGGDPTAVALGRVDGEAAPASADLQQMILGPQAQLPAQELELGGGGDIERCRRLLVERARVHHALVEEEAEELVAEVVVRGDVAGAATARIAPPMVLPAIEAGCEAALAVHGLLGASTVRHESHQSDEVVAVPVAVDIALRRAQDAAEDHATVEGGTMDLNADAGLSVTVNGCIGAFGQRDLAVVEAVERTMQQASRRCHGLS